MGNRKHHNKPTNSLSSTTSSLPRTRSAISGEDEFQLQKSKQDMKELIFVMNVGKNRKTLGYIDYTETMTSDDMVNDMRRVHKAATTGGWTVVLEMFKKKRELRTAKITPMEDTILHMAVSIGNKYVVERMVNLVRREPINGQDETSALLSSVDENGDEQSLVLGAENKKGNTPLHLAASMGEVEMCKKIGEVDPSLIVRLNIAGETPLFLAALHGKREAFLWLHYLYMDGHQVSSSRYAYYKRKNNDTILHCAIAGGHIDVAIEIVHLYKDHMKEMMKCNDNGLSPLHLLAAAPSGYQSSDLPGQSFIVKLLYHGVLRIKKKKQATTREELKQHEREPCCITFSLNALYNFIFDYEEGSSATTVIGNIFFLLKSHVGMLIFLLLGIFALIVLSPLLMLKNLFSLAGHWFLRIRKMKEKHTWCLQIMEELLQLAPNEYMSEIILRSESPRTSPKTKEDNSKEAGSIIVDKPLILAAKNGVIEMVEMILDLFPSTMYTENDEGKNIVLLAAEKRQAKLYQFLCENENLEKSIFGHVDKGGNTALHLAAKPEVNLNMQMTTMVEEFKWFELVKNSVPSELWEISNNEGKRAEEIFRDNFEQQMTSDREWVNQTSQACSVASTLVASMAFANVAGNFDEKNNSSLVALSLSLTSTISFLSILAFRSQSLYLWRYVPSRLRFAILTMFGSIVALWISLMLHDHSFKTYAIIGSPIALVTIFSLPTFIGPTLTYMFTRIPIPNRKAISAIRRTKNLNPQN